MIAGSLCGRPWEAVNGLDCAGSWNKFRGHRARRGIIRRGSLRTVRGIIFLWVSILLVCVLLAFSLVVYDYASAVARERFADTLTSLSRSVMANLDAQVAEMNRLSLTLIYSQVFQGLFAEAPGPCRAPRPTARAEDRASSRTRRP